MMKSLKKSGLSLASLIAIMAISSCSSAPDASEGAFFNTPSTQQQGDNTSETLNKIYMFSSAGYYNGNLGGRVGADNICQSNLPVALVDAGYETHAVLAFDSRDDMASFPTNFLIPTDEVIYAYDSNVVIANDWLDFMDGSLDAGMRAATLLPANTIYWTGFEPDGRLTQDTCNGFTSLSGADQAQIGNSDYDDIRWSAFQVDSCNGVHPILCVAF